MKASFLNFYLGFFFPKIVNIDAMNIYISIKKFQVSVFMIFYLSIIVSRCFFSSPYFQICKHYLNSEYSMNK